MSDKCVFNHTRAPPAFSLRAQAGEVLVDGMPLTELNTEWLRTHTGLVTQTPVLFPSTMCAP
jgi:ABC-type multidrug transport system fused ATPase/permease subunit